MGNWRGSSGMIDMGRRGLIAIGVAAIAAPALAQPAGSRVLRFVPHAGLTSLDPVWTTAWITRNHGYLVYDTLYSVDENFMAAPQMAAGHSVAESGHLWTIVLREGLRFHDGEP